MSLSPILKLKMSFDLFKFVKCFTFSSCALPELGRASATNVNKLGNFEYASLSPILKPTTWQAAVPRAPSLSRLLYNVNSVSGGGGIGADTDFHWGQRRNRKRMGMEPDGRTRATGARAPLNLEVGAASRPVQRGSRNLITTSLALLVNKNAGGRRTFFLPLLPASLPPSLPPSIR